MDAAAPPSSRYTGHGGHYTWIGGPMCAGKSSELIRLVRIERVAKQRVLTVKHSSDGDMGLSDDTLVNRNGLACPCRVAQSLESVCTPAMLDAYDVLAVDEAQFFDDLHEGVLYWLNAGKKVITVGVDADYLARPFHAYCLLVALATDVIKLKAVCMRCSERDAAFSKRLTAGTQVIELDKDDYEARCFRCFNEQ